MIPLDPPPTRLEKLLFGAFLLAAMVAGYAYGTFVLGAAQ